MQTFFADVETSNVVLVLLAVLTALAGFVAWRIVRARYQRELAERQAQDAARRLAVAEQEVSQLVRSSSEMQQFCEDGLAALRTAGVPWNPTVVFNAADKADLAVMLQGAQANPLSPRDELSAKLSFLQHATAEIKQFLDRKSELQTEAVAAVDHLEQRIQEVRALPFAHNLPLLPEQEAMPILHARHLYGEADPDPVLAECRQLLQQALDALCRNDVQTCQRAGRSARLKAEESLALIDSHVSARQELETGLMPAFQRLQRLEVRLREMADAHLEYTQLFPSERSDAPTRVYDNVRNAANHSLGSFYGLQDGYVNQRFVAARETLRRLIERLQRMEMTLPDLVVLLDKVKTARARVQSARQRVDEATAGLNANLDVWRFAVTDRELEESAELLSECSSVQFSDDWLTAEQALDALLVRVVQRSRHLQLRGNAWSAAKDNFARCSAVMAQTRAQFCEATGQKAEKWLVEAETSFKAVAQALQTSGSDWMSVTTDAARIEKLCQQFVGQIEQDKADYEAAMSTFKIAERKQKRLIAAAGSPNNPRMNAAWKLMDEARQAMKERRWGHVLTCATKARASFQASLNARGIGGN